MRKKKFPKTKNSEKYIVKKLDDYFIDVPLSKDVFGFLTAVTSEKIEGFFAVFEINKTIKVTEIYSKEILENMVIPDILYSYPESFYRIFPESEFKKITGKKK